MSARTTVDFGIDLGTTNSCIALLKGTQTDVIRNDDERDYTPSAVWIDRKNRLHVGRKAKEQYDADEENACIEFKLQMGKSWGKLFKRCGKGMKPEQMSAEVLKALVGDVRKRYSEDPHAAVITVPADFNLPECEATRKAAQLAGLNFTPLLQEPIAAALAYGFQTKSDKVFWLVYDLGGGTFDAAVLQVRDAMIRVVNHGGDKCMGGKLFDWEIVSQILAPAVAREYRLTDFKRGVPRWAAAFAKLKMAAEEAKIRVSRESSATIELQFSDEKGQMMEFEHVIERSALEQLIEPFILRTINICKQVLADKRLTPGNIERVLLVGGPTFTPYLRQRLADCKEGLGIALDFSVDPMTVVARGAAIFAGTQRIKTSAQAVSPGQLKLELEYQPMGADSTPLVGGRIVATAKQNFAGYTIEFADAEARPPWRSGKVKVEPHGVFATQVRAQGGRRNTFMIDLRDATGRKHETVPDRLTYTIGTVATDPPLTHSVGVAMANNEMDIFIPKGTALSARKKVVHRTAVAVRRGEAGVLIRIPVVEGENQHRADRNRLSGKLEIPAHKVKRDLPAGSEVEITIEIDQSRLVKTQAYIPLLDEHFEVVFSFKEKIPSHDQLRTEAEREKQRLQEARDKARNVADPRARELLGRIDDERMEHDVDTSLAAARSDPDAAQKCQQRLLDLRMGIDSIEDALEWPALLAEAEEKIKEMQRIVGKYPNSSVRQNAATLERETREAMKGNDADKLRRKINEMSGLTFRVLREQPEFWVRAACRVGSASGNNARSWHG